jgi:uncharacterized protein (TIGR03437 family)
MKRLALVALAVQSLFAADFLTGQAARAVIGQKYFTTEDNNSSAAVLGGVSGLALWNGKLFVVDSNRVSAAPINHRVLIYNNILSQIPTPTAEIKRVNSARCPVCGFTADVELGQSDFSIPDDGADPHTTQEGLYTPTAVATDGTHLVVADTDNNRVLIWNTIPTSNNAPADLVLGQKDFTSYTANSGSGDSRVPNASSLRGPQGVWIQDGKLFVADNQNHRVLIWNTFPTANYQAADLVLGQPNLTTATESDLTKQESAPTATSLLNPVSVTSDGVRLYVTDLGHNRVLIWNTIPTTNTAPADIAVGQPDLVSATSNNSYKLLSYDSTTGVTKLEKILCDSNGTDTNGDLTFPSLCGRTLSFPRYALSDGKRLFIADGGNDRVLVFNTIPTASGAKADAVLGQITDAVVQTSDNTTDNVADSMRRGAADSMRTPSGLAWDGTNLFIGEPFSRRVLVYSPASGTSLPKVRNAASMEVYALGLLTVSGTITTGETVTLTVDTDRKYKYTAKANDTLASVANGLTTLINAGTGDSSILATALPALAQIRLTSRLPGELGNATTLAVAQSNSSGLTLATESTTMSGGRDAARLAAGTLVSIFGSGFTAKSGESAPDVHTTLPTTLAGVEVFVDGLKAPLLYAGPKQINAQLPFEILDATSSNLYIRTTNADGTVTVSNPVGVPLITANPGIFAKGGTDPRPGIVMHSSSYATGSILLTGSITAGDVATITIGGANYFYTVLADDTLDTVRDALIALINTNSQVEAYAAGVWDRIRLRARKAGTAGNGIAYSTTTSDSATLVLSESSSSLCCANGAGALVTTANPALAGETITVYATGLGMVNDPAKYRVHTGVPYPMDAPEVNTPEEYVSSITGGKTANVLSSAMKRGEVGIFQVDLELNTSLTTSDVTQAYIAQGNYISNVITFPVKGAPPTVTSITPTSGVLGATVTVTITGTGYYSTGTTCSFGAGITVNSCTYSSSTTLVASITISSTAATGTRTVTVTDTTTGSGSKADAFTVNAS